MAIAPVDVEIGSDAPRGGGGKTVLPFVLPKSEHRRAIPRVHVHRAIVDYRRCHHRRRQVNDGKVVGVSRCISELVAWPKGNSFGLCGLAICE